ncbi:MAG: 6-phosphogluconolactonase [Actinomycetes bacterium]
MTPEVLVTPDHESLAAAVAARVITGLIDALEARPVAHLCLTGGTIGTDSLAAITASPASTAVDWSRVHIWWSDERFEPTGDPLRNETGARAALLDHVPLNPTQVHPMPAPGGSWGDDVEAAAAAYAAELVSAGDGADSPVFDLLLLGVGPDGHVASLFPGFPEIDAPGTVCGVKGSPKPPPIRISFTLAAINIAREVWLVASGAEKAHAIAAAITSGAASQLPSGMVHGTERTLALLDVSAASELA